MLVMRSVRLTSEVRAQLLGLIENSQVGGWLLSVHEYVQLVADVLSCQNMTELQTALDIHFDIAAII
jgi:hypothetical protein